MLRVSFIDLRRQYVKIREEIDSALKRVLESGNFILGDEVKNFEKEIAKFLNVKHAIGVASGTDALVLSLRALGLKEGDIAITTPFTFFSTVSSVRLVNATPSFVDINPISFNMDVERLEYFLRKAGFKGKVKVIIPVHIFGLSCQMDRIMEIAKDHGIAVVEDAAQAMGAEYRGKKVGTIGDLGCFSFYPTKNLGAYGDGGLVVTNDDELAEKVRHLRQHGAKVKYEHYTLGYNSRLDEIQAAVLRAKLAFLNSWIRRRRDIASFYSKSLEGLKGIEVPAVPNDLSHVFNIYTIRVKEGMRDRLRSFLRRNGIETEVYYPLPAHLQPALSYLKYEEGSFPEAERACREALSLPIHPEMKDEEKEYVTMKIKEFLVNNYKNIGCTN